MKWTAAVVFAVSLYEVSAKTGYSDVMKQAIKASQGVPALREKESQRRAEFQTKMQNLAEPKSDRMLQNNYNGNQQDGEGGYWYGNDWNNYYWNQDMQEEGFGFDISAYSIKYTGCHTVETYNENLAANDMFETVLGTQRYATFRLCPADRCNTYNRWGCDRDYGEYVVPLDLYIESIVGYGQQRVMAYCEFCEDCAAREAYRSFAQSQINQMQYDMQKAEELYQDFKQNMMAQNAYNQNGNAGYYQQGDDYANEEDDADMMLQYYKQIAQNAQNGNGNQGGNGQGAYNYNGYQQGNNPANQYNFYSQNSWNFANQNNNNYQANQQQQAQQEVNQNYWSNMGQFATFNGRSIYPGYFTNQGEFVAEWGYFYQGNWVSMEQNEVVWDEALYGEMPQAWENYIGQDPDGIESCEYQYSKGCYKSYDTCMSLLQEKADDDWFPDWYQENYDYQNGNNAKAYANYQAYVEQQQQKEESQYLAMTGQLFACHQVNYQPGYDGEYNQNYQQQQYNNAQFYQLNKYMEAQLELCNGDAACEYDIEQEMAQNQAFAEWLEQYNQDQYDQYINGEKMYYIGAACGGSDEIVLKVYNDEDCSYEDESVTAEKILGFDIFDFMQYDLIPQECIPCDNQNYMQDQYYFGEDNQDANGYENAEEITAMCSMLYQVGGKCNENLNPGNQFDGWYENGEYVQPNYNMMYQSAAQEMNEKVTCSFIESLNSGTYDQSGKIYINDGIWGAPARWQQGIASASRNMPGGLKAALFLTALAACLMGVWACMLHGALARKNIPWQPKAADDVTRQNSGIVMGRSRSGPVTHPLI